MTNTKTNLSQISYTLPGAATATCLSVSTIRRACHAYRAGAVNTETGWPPLPCVHQPSSTGKSGRYLILADDLSAWVRSLDTVGAMS
ncbi:MAG: hypothetical protein FWD29_03380 [Micrococcales bacterium]|nr:hypothetical protein [Micrococcales bacterium]